MNQHPQKNTRRPKEQVNPYSALAKLLPPDISYRTRGNILASPLLGPEPELFRPALPLGGRLAHGISYILFFAIRFVCVWIHPRFLSFAT
jgi:hypothetical protein